MDKYNLILKRGSDKYFLSKKEGEKHNTFSKNPSSEGIAKFDKDKADSYLQILKTQWPRYEFISEPIGDVNEMSATGTGASMTPGQGEQIATPAAFSRKSLDEGYNQFKKQVTTKTPQSSSNAAVRTIRRKLKEINKIIDYSHKLKEEVGSNSKAKTDTINELNSYLHEISKKLKKL